MTNSITSNTDTAQAVASSLGQSMDEYANFTLNTVVAEAPTTGNGVHDQIASSMTSALASWRALTEADAKAIADTAAALEETDRTLGQDLLGLQQASQS